MEIIKMNRGDTQNLTIRIPKKDNPNENYFLTPEDVLYFALLNPHQAFEDAIILRGYTVEDLDKYGQIKIELKPEDTKNLPVGIYYYSAKLQTGGTHAVVGDLDSPKEVRTIIPRTKLILNY